MKSKLNKIFQFYGAKHQLKKLKEEHKEVAKAIKEYEYIRRRENDLAWILAKREHVAEEIADCFNVLGEFMVAYGIPCEKVKEIMTEKQDRQLWRMQKELENKSKWI